MIFLCVAATLQRLKSKALNGCQMGSLERRKWQRRQVLCLMQIYNFSTEGMPAKHYRDVTENAMHLVFSKQENTFFSHS